MFFLFVLVFLCFFCGLCVVFLCCGAQVSAGPVRTGIVFFRLTCVWFRDGRGCGVYARVPVRRVSRVLCVQRVFPGKCVCVVLCTVPVRLVPLPPGSGRRVPVPGLWFRAGVLCVAASGLCGCAAVLVVCVWEGGSGLCFAGGFFAGGGLVFEFPDPVAEDFEGGFTEFPAECFCVVSGGVGGDAGHGEEVAE